MRRAKRCAFAAGNVRRRAARSVRTRSGRYGRRGRVRLNCQRCEDNVVLGERHVTRCRRLCRNSRGRFSVRCGRHSRLDRSLARAARIQARRVVAGPQVGLAGTEITERTETRHEVGIERAGRSSPRAQTGGGVLQKSLICNAMITVRRRCLQRLDRRVWLGACEHRRAQYRTTPPRRPNSITTVQLVIHCLLSALGRTWWRRRWLAAAEAQGVAISTASEPARARDHIMTACASTVRRAREQAQGWTSHRENAEAASELQELWRAHGVRGDAATSSQKFECWAASCTRFEVYARGKVGALTFPPRFTHVTRWPRATLRTSSKPPASESLLCSHLRRLGCISCRRAPLHCPPPQPGPKRRRFGGDFAVFAPAGPSSTDMGIAEDIAAELGCSGSAFIQHEAAATVADLVRTCAAAHLPNLSQVASSNPSLESPRLGRSTWRGGGRGGKGKGAECTGCSPFGHSVMARPCGLNWVLSAVQDVLKQRGCAHSERVAKNLLLQVCASALPRGCQCFSTVRCCGSATASRHERLQSHQGVTASS